jgi:hypothetical protein
MGNGISWSSIISVVRCCWDGIARAPNVFIRLFPQAMGLIQPEKTPITIATRRQPLDGGL